MAGNNAQGSAQATVDHDEIREWVEQHGGHPAQVKRTRRGNTPGILRIDFPGFSGENSLEEISWDEFFQRFDESNLAFLYQDKTKSGRPSRFNKLVSRDSVEIRTGSARKGASRSPRVPRGSDRRQRRGADQPTPSRTKPAARGTARKASKRSMGAARNSESARNVSGSTPRSRAKKTSRRTRNSPEARGPARVTKKRATPNDASETKRSTARR